MAATETTSLNTQWVVKMLIPLVVLLVLGVWGLYDATIAYPNRGMEDASYQQKLYLDAALEAGKLSKADASIPDPQARLGVLAAKREALGKASESATRLQADQSNIDASALQLRKLRPELMDFALLRWLDSLNLVSRLDKQITDMADPAAEHKKLIERWKNADQPKPLSTFDLPSQWLITFAGFGGAGYMIFLVLLPAARTSYKWEPAEKRLHLPGGRTLTPADIAEFDKRKWDKFFITLNVKESAGGGAVKLDLLRHTKLEAWILEMEAIAFPESVKPPEGEAAAPAGESGAPQPVAQGATDAVGDAGGGADGKA